MTIIQENQMFISSLAAVLLVLGIALARDKITEKSRLTAQIESSLTIANQCREYNARATHPRADLMDKSTEELQKLALFYDNDVLDCRGALHAQAPKLAAAEKFLN